MSSVLRDLYYGKIRPVEIPLQAEGEEQARLEQEARDYEALTESLDPSCKEALDRFLAQRTKSGQREYAETFSNGVRFGVRLMLEVFQGELASQEAL